MSSLQWGSSQFNAWLSAKFGVTRSEDPHHKKCRMCGLYWEVHSGVDCPLNGNNPRDGWRETNGWPEQTDLGIKKMRTQKAQGLNALSVYGMWTGGFIIQSEKPSENAELPFEKTFARPCPTRPRHGFVESRTVSSIRELRALWDETLTHDHKAEIILMPRCEASLSAILTSKAIAVGLGTDGATAGKAGTITFPLSAVHIPKTLLRSARVKTEPYFEILSRPDGNVQFVQLRDGEQIKSFGDFIPADITVKHVLSVKADTDLLAWEKAIEQAEPGSIVHHPGGNMLSHFSVHASLHNIPIIFGEDAPVVGATLKATTNKIQTHLRGLRVGLRYGLEMKTTKNYAHDMRVIFFATHQSAALRQTQAGAIAVGIAAALFARYGTAACLGELRHSGRKKFHRHCARNSVYTEAFNDYAKARDRLRAAWRDFAFGSWGSSFGGKAWANCTAHTILLDRRIQDVTRKLDEETALALIKQLNVNVNLAHNGGWWLNKFTSKSEMDSAAEGKLAIVASAAFLTYPHVVAAMEADIPLENYRGVNLPKLPAIVTLMKIPNNREIKIQIGMRRIGHVKCLLGDSAAKAIGELLQTMCKQEKGFHAGDSMYYRLTPAFMAAFEIAFPKPHERVKRKIAELRAELNPFIS